jgi:hypothetical protein
VVQRLRGDVRNDPTLKTVLNDPDIVAALDVREQTMRRRMRDKVETALQSTDSRKLKSWVAVAVWEDEDGTTTEHLTSDDHTSVLEVRSLLTGALWAASHTAD